MAAAKRKSEVLEKTTQHCSIGCFGEKTQAGETTTIWPISQMISDRTTQRQIATAGNMTKRSRIQRARQIETRGVVRVASLVPAMQTSNHPSQTIDSRGNRQISNESLDVVGMRPVPRLNDDEKSKERVADISKAAQDDGSNSISPFN